MTTIYLYIVAVDTGFAPCVQKKKMTLNICKGDIRRIAKEGDIVIGIMTQAKNAGASWHGHYNATDVVSHLPKSGAGTFRVIFAMRVGAVWCMEDYDVVYRGSRKDSIYDFEGWHRRRGPHGAKQQLSDLRGRNTLLSQDFTYHGRNAPQVPLHLLKRMPVKNWRHIGKGHRTIKPTTAANIAFIEDMRKWLDMDGPRVKGLPFMELHPHALHDEAPMLK